MNKNDTFDLLVTLPKTTGDRYDKTKHLKEKIHAIRNDGTAWWDLRRDPKKWNWEKVFVVCDGSLWGYFTVDIVDQNYDYTDAKAMRRDMYELRELYGSPPEGVVMRIYLDEWIPIKLIQMKGFQGFRYMKIPYETFKHDFDILSSNEKKCRNCDHNTFLNDTEPIPPCTEPRGRELL